MPQEFILLKQKQIWQRIDTFVLAALYPLTLVPCIYLLNQHWVSEPPAEATKGIFSLIVDHLDVSRLESYTAVVMSPFIVMAIHLLIFLFSTWSVKFRSFLCFSKADASSATHVVFIPKERQGACEIVPFDQTTTPPTAIFQQKKREFINGQFASLKYPTNLTIQEYLDNKKGLTSEEKQKLFEYFGPNSYQIPIPTFKELMKEHIVAPLFVFQVFSIVCWMLDEYFIFPLFSLISLLIIEANTVSTRQSNLLELRGVENEPTRIHVYRDGQWRSLESEHLLPGDLVFLNQEILCPADLLLLSGKCVTNEAMLTGESTPQVKDSIVSLPRNHKLDISKDNRFIVFGGTKIEQIIPGDNHIYSPMKGCVAYVISTGLGSSQGRLIRTILFASQRVSAESSDSMKLLIFLSIFAVIASLYVIYYGMQSDTISTFRIIVECLLIITSSIPPDLPMELTFSVNASLLALSKLAVFCTEPFRIPFAGTVSVCCFDKTGTLTAEEYKLAGIDEMKKSGRTVTINGVKGELENNSNILSDEPLMVIGACHSLINGNGGKIIGDSLEATSFSQLGFSITPGGKAKHKRFTITTQKTFHFSADLRRMTTISGIATNKLFAFTKGAPDIVADHLADVPENYFNVYRSYTRQGCRVLALAYRPLDNNEISNLSSLTREQAEQGLIFAGFSIFASPMKKGTEDTIVELLKSTHRVILITGDDPLTACHIASRLHIISKPPLIYDIGVLDANGEPAKDDSEYAFCYTGKGISHLSDKEFANVVKHCNVFARMSPQNKESVLLKLGELGERTLMCGDGTNDVGALKQAHVGVGLVENSIDIEFDDEYRPKLGAASIAAPFVSKRSTISACLDLIRFGRATLSSTIDLFKQLSLNCLISAYSVSVLFIENVKFGDQQLTIFAMGLSVALMAISWAKPLRTLSKERPFDSQFNAYLVTSVILQFAFHLIILYCVRELVFTTGYVSKPFNYKIKFEPSLMNTAMYIITNEMQVATFIANYRGRPFMQSFFENRLLSITILILIVLILIIFMDANDMIRDTFQLVSFPSEVFRNKLFMLCFVDMIAAIIIEKVCLFLFTIKNKIESKNLVDQDTIKSLESYQPKNDDTLPEDKHSFGIKDMFKQNFELQKKMIQRRNEYNMKDMLASKKRNKGRKAAKK